MPYDNPLERAARDAERIRSWVGSEDRDFIVKVYAAVVTSDTSLSRTSACAVISTEQIPAWLASLPPQRSLSADRRADLVAQIKSIA